MPPDRAADAPPLADRAAGASGGPASPGAGPRSTLPGAGRTAGRGAPDPSPPSGPTLATAAGRPFPTPPLRRAPWVTALLTVAVVLGYLLLQSAAGLIALVPAAAAGGVPSPGRLLGLLWERAGLAAWVGIAVAAPAATAALWRLARWQGPGPARRRLGLVPARRRDALVWLLAVLAFGWLYERASVWLDRPPLPPVMEQVFRTAGWLPALVVAVVVLAPAFEELAFRGFCLGGLARLGAVPAVALSSALFAVIHVQYDLFDVGSVLALGVLFGAARWQSGSTLLTLGLHAFHNALASVQALWTVGGAP